MSVKTIVVALALQTEGDPVIGRAIQLARRHDARLIVLHVIEGHTGEDPHLPRPLDRAAITRILQSQASDRLARTFEATVAPADVLIETGKPHLVIDATACRFDADLVVIGPGIPRSLREKVFGSTADRVVRASARPVLVVRLPPDRDWRRAAAAIDLSATSKSAASAATRIAPDATLELVHIVEIPLGFEQAMLTSGTPTAQIAHYRKAKVQSARKDLIAAFPDKGGPMIRVLQGDADRVLIRMATKGRIDLLAIGAQGKNAASRLMLGSVAGKVLKQATCDVLVVPTVLEPDQK